MKKILIAAVLATVSGAGYAAQDELTGDTKYACEAVLCLSSSTRPTECSPSLTKYFSITDKRPWKIPLKRKNFLNQCPASNDEGMPALIDAIVGGADHCDVRSLNVQLARQKRERTCKLNSDGQQVCTTEIKTVIDDKKPAGCTAYEANPYTVIKGPKYVGLPERGGRWVEPDQYEQAKAEYDERIRKEDEEAKKEASVQAERKRMRAIRRNDYGTIEVDHTRPRRSIFGGDR